MRNNGINGQNNIAVVGVTAPPADEPIESFSAQPPVLLPGESANLNWHIDPAASSASIDQGIGNVLPETNASGGGFHSVTPAMDTTYTLSVTAPGGSEPASATVQVLPLAFFQASSTFLAAGDAVTLTWRVRADATVTLSGFGDMDAQTDANGVGSFNVNPTASTVYTLTATAGGRTEESAIRVITKPAGQAYALIDLGATEGQPEPSCAGGVVVGAGVNNTNATNLAPVTLTSDTGDQFTVALDNVDPLGTPFGGLDWRDRGTAPAIPLARLAEAFVKNNAGMLRVTLGSLPAATYNVVSYHVDPANSQCADIRVLVTDANGSGVDTGARGNASFPGGVPGVGGLNTAIVDASAARFTITSNGTDDVSIFFDGSAAGDTEVPLDGLWLATAPPPAQPIEIVNIDLSVTGGTATVAIEFRSTPGSTYRVRAGQDLVNWSDLATNHPASAGATTTFTESGIPLSTPRRFYQVIQN